MRTFEYCLSDCISIFSIICQTLPSLLHWLPSFPQFFLPSFLPGRLWFPSFLPFFVAFPPSLLPPLAYFILSSTFLFLWLALFLLSSAPFLPSLTSFPLSFLPSLFCFLGFILRSSFFGFLPFFRSFPLFLTSFYPSFFFTLSFLRFFLGFLPSLASKPLSSAAFLLSFLPFSPPNYLPNCLPIYLLSIYYPLLSSGQSSVV